MGTAEQKKGILKIWAKLKEASLCGYGKIQKMRFLITSPICSLLIRLHINQSQVSVFRFLFIPGFAWLWIIQEYEWSILVLAAFWVLDWIDGDISRALKHNNDLGKFEDITIDNFLVVAFPLVLIQQNLLPGLLGAVYIFLVTQSWWFAVVRRNLSQKSDWLLWAFAGYILHVLRFWIMPICIALYAFWRLDWFTPVTAVLSILLGIHLANDYYQMIKNRLLNRN